MSEAPTRPPRPARPLRVAALVKQIPAVEHASLGPDGRLRRSGLPLQMNDYCRRAVAKGHELATRSGGTLTVITLGPPSAEEVVREAVAFGADRAVHVCDPAFAGSDTYATARALARAIELAGPFDLVLTGRNSIDADTGQVPPSIAELLGWPFAADVLSLSVAGDLVAVALDHDDESVRARIELPVVLSCAERLCDPCKVPDPARRAAVSPDTIERLDAAALGPGPWGQTASLTRVGPVRAIEIRRARTMLDGPIDDQIAALVAILESRGALASPRLGPELPAPRPADGGQSGIVPGPSARGSGGSTIGVVIEPGRRRAARELLGTAAALASEIGGSVHAIGPDPGDLGNLAVWGADTVVVLTRRGGAEPVEAAVAAGVSAWCDDAEPWAVLGPSTAWGREILSRVAVRVRAGLTGDAIDLSTVGGRLVAHKPAFGGALVADIECTSSIQMATVRAGTLPLRSSRPVAPVSVEERPLGDVGGITVESRNRTSDFDALAGARVVIGVGQGIPFDRYGDLSAWAGMLRAELAATRKVTDLGWMPRARQVGITGLSVAPELYLAAGLSGKFNHMAGVRNAGTIVAINTDPEAPVFEWADVGLVAPWDAVLGSLAAAVAARASDSGRDREPTTT